MRIHSNHRRLALLALAWSILSLPSSGQVRLVRDIAPPVATGSEPTFKLVEGSRTFFTATALSTGTELWVTDGTTSGTRLVKDIAAGTAGTHFANPGRQPWHDFISVGQEVYWRRSGEINIMFELWRTDGSAEGTSLAFSLGCDPIPLDWAPYKWAATLGNTLFFLPKTCGDQIWKLDTTTGAASLAGEFPATWLFNVNGHVVAMDQTTMRFSDDPDAGFSAPVTGINLWGAPFEFDGGLIFMSDSGTEVWVSDGTAEGTSLRANLGHPTPSRILGVVGTKVFFHGSDSLQILDLATGNITRISNFRTPLAAATLDDSFIIITNDGTLGESSMRLWRSDGTVAGTQVLRSFDYFQVSQNFTSMGGRLYFEGHDLDHGTEPWVTDGTVEGTVPLADINPGPSSARARFATVGSQLLIASDHPTLGRELWISDGSPTGTTGLLANIAEDTGSSRLAGLTDSGSLLYFQASHRDTGREAWVSDGTTDGTQLLIDLIPEVNYGGFVPLGSIGDAFYFNTRFGSASDTYVTHGTTATTLALGAAIPELRQEIGQSVELSSSFVLVGSGGVVLSTDGTPEGTNYLTTGRSSGTPIRFRNRAFFYLQSPNTGLWVTDGTPEGTSRLVRVFVPILQQVDDKLFFRSRNLALGTELWLTEGSAETTRLVADFIGGSSSSSFGAMSQLSGRLYYFLNATELWTSDGTAAGTYAVTTVPSPLNTVLFTTGSRLLFFAKDSNGWELWQSDGTAGGTSRVADICPGPGSSVEGVSKATVIDGVLYFPANDCSSGLELWKSDGTPAGTMQVTDIAAGEESSSPASFAEMGGEIYFSAYRPDIGVEFFAYRPELDSSSTTLSATPSTIALGGPVELEAVVSHSGTVTPSGAVEFLVDGEVLKTVPITGGSAVATISSLAGGAHAIVARYTGDAFIASSTSQASSILVSPQPVTLSAAPSALDSAFGTILSVSAVVEGVFTTPHFPNGLVIVREGTQQLAGGSIVNGVATITLPLLSAGTHHLTVSYERDSSFATNDVAMTINVSVLEATLTVSGLSPVIDQTTTMYLQALLSRANQAPLAGKLRLLDGGQLLREALPGVTSIFQTLTGLSVGTHHFVVEYVGDPNVTAASVTIDVVVTNFPTLASISPAGVCAGQTIFDFLIDGNYFDATTTVTFDLHPLSTQFLTVGQLRAFNTIPLPPMTGRSLGIARADGASKSWQLPYHGSYAAPVVTAPPALVVVATETVDRVQAVTAAASPALAAWLDSGSATDDCSYAAPERLPRTISGVPVTPTTPIFYGNLNIHFPYRDTAGHTTSVPSSITVIPRGSLDGNVVVNATDMVILANYLVGNIQQGSAAFSSPLEAGDLNADGRVNSVDLVILANLLVGNITEIPAR